MRHKYVAAWSETYGSRRHHARPAMSRDSWPPRALNVFAAAARFVERTTRRNG
jgi:uncharacterized membrane protein YccC